MRMPSAMFKRLSNRIAYALSLAIGFVPCNKLRVALCRWLRGYDIAWSPSLGSGTVLDVEHAIIGRAAVANHSIVGLGSVVTKKFTDDYLMIAGVPARVIKENYYYKEHDPAAGQE